MAARFCSQCGAKLLSGAAFCVECGERQPGVRAPRRGFSIPVQRWAPLLVVLAVVAIGGGAVVLGVLSPKVPPSVPRHDAPPVADAAAGGALPENHPPITIPDQVKQAIRDMAQKAAAAPDDMDTWKHLAEVQYRAGQLEHEYLTQAAESYRHVVDREPDNLDAIRALGNIAFDQQQPGVAVELYQRYLKQKPDDLDVQTDLGTMYLAAGKSDQAIQQYESVLKTNPSFFQAQFNLAIAYRSLNQPDQALAALEKSRAMAPDDKTRTQVDQLLARLKGQPVPEPVAAGEAPAGQAAGQAPAAPAPAVVAPAAATGTFQGDAEGLFRQNPIMGPKVQRIEWAGAETAKVYLRDFPMDQMPEGMRSMFMDRMKGRIKDRKEAYKVTQTTRFDLVDDASGRVMGTITE